MEEGLNEKSGDVTEPTAAGMTRLDSQLMIGLHRVVQDLDRRTASVARAHGLTVPQFAVLEALLNKGPLPMGELREAVLSSDGTIPVVVRHLQGRGLVERRRDDCDGRRSIVSLTPAGRELAERVCPDNASALERSLAAWSPEERSEVVRLVRGYRRGNR